MLQCNNIFHIFINYHMALITFNYSVNASWVLLEAKHPLSLIKLLMQFFCSFSCCRSWSSVHQWMPLWVSPSDKLSPVAIPVGDSAWRIPSTCTHRCRKSIVMPPKNAHDNVTRRNLIVWRYYNLWFPWRNLKKITSKSECHTHSARSTLGCSTLEEWAPPEATMLTPPGFNSIQFISIIFSDVYVLWWTGIPFIGILTCENLQTHRSPVFDKQFWNY